MDATIKPMKYFEQLDSDTLCRNGGNGPAHLSQVFAINKYAKNGDSLLDVGCGSGTTLEALRERTNLNLDYKGVDFVEKHIEFCKKTFPDHVFEVQDALHLQEEDHSWDIVYARHVVDHLHTFQKAFHEFTRVANKYVIVVLFIPLFDDERFTLQTIMEGGKVYHGEYRNQYSKPQMLRFFESLPEWELEMLTENVGEAPINKDTIIVLKRREHAEL